MPESSLTPFIGFKAKGLLPIGKLVRRLALSRSRSAWSRMPAAADASWAQPQIKRVVEAGLLAEQVASFKPKQPLTQKALAETLETLSLASEEPVDYRYPVTAAGPRGHDPRARRCARRLSRPRRLRPLR